MQLKKLVRSKLKDEDNNYISQNDIVFQIYTREGEQKLSNDQRIVDLINNGQWNESKVRLWNKSQLSL